MTKRSDGRWQQSIVVNGIRRYFYGNSKAEVLKKISAFKDKEENGLPFETVADEYWEIKERDLSPTSIDAYRRPIARAREYFDGVYIKSIKPLDVIRFMDQLISTWHMAQKTAGNQLTVIRGIFQYAVMQGYVDANVARDVELPKKLRKTPRHMPPSEEIQKIKDAVDKPFGLFAYALLYTGLRRNELRAIRYEDIDRESHTITVDKAIYCTGNKPKLKPPKTETGIRTVPLLAKLEEHLPNRKRGVVFADENGDYLTESRFRGLWEKYRKDNDIHCTMHELRHAFATMLLENDIPVKDAQKILGHAQASTTQDIYQEIRKARSQTITERLLNADIV